MTKPKTAAALSVVPTTPDEIKAAKDKAKASARAKAIADAAARAAAQQMTPDEIKAARSKLGLTQAELADALELEGIFGKDTVRNWERGKRPISGPARVAIRLMVARAGFGKPGKAPANASKLGGVNEPTMKAPAK